MADQTIGSLPGTETVDDASLFVAEQDGEAVKVTGAQWKAFAQAAVQTQVSEAAQSAAEAEAAREAIENMAVSATSASGDTPTVTKTVSESGAVTLTFGLIPGATGPEGPPGPKGDTGTGLDILGTYATLQALEAAVTQPGQGDMYNVGTSAPYSIYMWDTVENDWLDQGQLQGENGTTFTPSVSENGELSWSNNGGLPNPESVNIRGPAGPKGDDGAPGADGQDGADGAAGPNEISAATGTAYTGILKGNGTSVVQAVSGTDYLTPIPGGVTGNLVTIGTGGTLADSGKTPEDLGGGGSGGGWVKFITSVTQSGYVSPLPEINLETSDLSIDNVLNYSVIEFKMELFYAVASGSGTLGYAIMNGANEVIGYLTVSAPGANGVYAMSKCTFFPMSRISYNTNGMGGPGDSMQVKFFNSYTGTDAYKITKLVQTVNTLNCGGYAFYYRTIT